jgi:GNAT superfamily N-acetyltransferase
LSDPDLVIRPAGPADCAFAYETKRAAFREYIELQYGAWDEAHQLPLHEERFGSQPFWIAMWKGEDAGMMSGEVIEGVFRLYQLFLLPEFQSRGVGRACMEWVMSQGMPVRLRVLKVNPRARAFYERLGFELVGDDGTHDVMTWHPRPAGSEPRGSHGAIPEG